MVLDRSARRQVEEGRGHDPGHIGHDAEVRLERRELFVDRRASEALRLEDGQAVLAGRDLQRVRAAGPGVGGAIDRDDIVAARDQRVEDRLAESLLAVDDDTHEDPLLILCGPPVYNTLDRPQGRA